MFGLSTPFTNPVQQVPWGDSPYGTQGLSINPFALQGQPFQNPLSSSPIGSGYGAQPLQQVLQLLQVVPQQLQQLEQLQLQQLQITDSTARSADPGADRTTPATDSGCIAARSAALGSDARAGQLWAHIPLGHLAADLRRAIGPSDVARHRKTCGST